MRMHMHMAPSKPAYMLSCKSTCAPQTRVTAS